MNWNKSVVLWGHSFLVLLLLLGLLQILMAQSGSLFWFELSCFSIFLVLGLVGLAGFGSRWGKGILFVVYLLYLVNIIVLWGILTTFYLVLAVLGLVGFFVALPTHKAHSAPEEPHSIVLESPEQEKVTTFTPGKYIASKNSNVYHEPKCEWAKKITKSRRVWFNNKEEALHKGYKAHNCK